MSLATAHRRHERGALSKSVHAVRSAREKLTDFHQPMLAQIGDKPFDDSGWLFEVKWDGYRAVAEVSKNEVRLYSRNGLSFVDLYAPVAQELKKIKDKMVHQQIESLERGTDQLSHWVGYREHRHRDQCKTYEQTVQRHVKQRTDQRKFLIYQKQQDQQQRKSWKCNREEKGQHHYPT